MPTSGPQAAAVPTAPAPLFRDPVHDGATDPTLVFNHAEGTWWMVYTQRRADAPPLPGVEWVHGTDLGVASSADRGRTWVYRGTVQGLDTSWGRHTYWAPEILHHDGVYHMYVSYIEGVPDRWAGHERTVRHYTSTDLAHWSFRSTLALSSRFVIDACVAPRPGGGWRLWYKDEAHGAHTWCADSPDLHTWTVVGPAVTHRAHEGPNVFRLGGHWWMLVDEWQGQRVLRSDDQDTWHVQGLVLDVPGTRPDDAGNGLHADVVVTGTDEASVFYFTHPDRVGPDGAVPDDAYPARRSSVQVARLHVVDGTLVCHRDAPLTTPVLPARGTA